MTTFALYFSSSEVYFKKQQQQQRAWRLLPNESDWQLVTRLFNNAQLHSFDHFINHWKANAYIQTPNPVYLSIISDSVLGVNELW